MPALLNSVTPSESANNKHCRLITLIGHTESVDVLVVTMLVEPFEQIAAAVVKEKCVGVIGSL